MKSLLMFGALFVCAAAISRPLVIENNSALPPYAEDFAFAGDELMSTHVGFTGGNPPDEEYEYFVDLYRRGSDGKWTLAKELMREHSTEYGGASVSMSSTVAAIGMPCGLQIWERTSSGWVRGKLDSTLELGGALAIAGNTILAAIPSPGVCWERAAVLTRGTNGVWGMSAELDVAPGVCLTSGALDNGRAILGAQDRDDTIAIDRAFIFEQSGSTWNLAATLSPNDGSTKFAGNVALRGDVAIVSANKRGSHVYERTTVGWQLVAFLANEDSYDGSQEDYALRMTDEFVVKSGTNINRQNSVAYVYRRLTNRTFEHVANLASRYGMSNLLIEGRRVIGGVVGDIHEFNLPTSFSVAIPVQDDFESGAAAGWTPTPGSQFTIASNGQTHVYRQTNSGDADAIYSADLRNQHVSADFRINAFLGSGEHWVGLITRYTSPGNYYYVTLRNPGNQLVLRRMLNGVFTDMARYTMPATLGWHRLGLESTGTLHNVYVDGVLVAYATDASHTHGRSGFRMHNVSADVDNFVVTPGPLARQDYTDRVTSGGIWDGNWVRGGSTFIQTSPDAGDARALTGLPRKDGVVQANVTFYSGASTSTPWVGLIVRYLDSRNYYYVTMRANELSLRKLTNGAITVLDTEPYTRQAGVPVKMRLEAVRDRVRVYVNDELRLESAGADIVAGKVGLMTYKASAKFENYVAYEP
jgi:hypothetical protein